MEKKFINQFTKVLFTRVAVFIKNVLYKQNYDNFYEKYFLIQFSVIKITQVFL